MAEQEVVVSSKRRQIRQPPSVPFLWEERPGVAKKDWKPVVSSPAPVVTPPPVKLIASVPFSWEEKPGKPLPYCSHSPEEAIPVKLITFPSPPACYQGYYNHHCRCEDGAKDHCNQEEATELDVESFSLGTDDSFSSASSLVPSVAVPAAVPAQDSAFFQPKEPSSPGSETDSSTSSYATGISSLVGAEFLECLFPLYPPNGGFLGNIRNSKKSSLNTLEPNSRDCYHEGNSSVTVRKTPTLGELIMMSRRRSCQRKAVQMKNRNLSMELMNKKFGCFILETTTRMIVGPLRKRRHQRLKFI